MRFVEARSYWGNVIRGDYCYCAAMILRSYSLVLVKPFIYIWLHHLKIINVLLQHICSWDPKRTARSCSAVAPSLFQPGKHSPTEALNSILLSSFLPACDLDAGNVHRRFAGLQIPWCLSPGPPLHPSVRDAEESGVNWIPSAAEAGDGCSKAWVPADGSY